jgi:hypothetical protein
MVLVIDSNDNPPIFIQHTYTSLIDEGVATFEPPLIVQVSRTKINVLIYTFFSINLNKLGNSIKRTSYPHVLSLSYTHRY